MTGIPSAEHTTLRDVSVMLFRQRWKIVAVLAAVVTAVAAGTFLSPRIYMSEAQLFFRLGSESITADPTLMSRIAPIVSVGQAREAELRTGIDILRSRELAQRLVDKAGVETVYGKALPADVEARKQVHERAITAFLRDLKVEVDKQSNIVTIGLEHRSAATAQALLRDYLRMFLDRHMEINLGTPSLALFQEQTAQFERQVALALKELSMLRKEVGSGNTKDAQFILMQQVAQLRLAVARTRAEQLSATKQAESLDSACKSLADEVVARRRTGIPNPVADKMRGSLFDLQVQARQIESTYRQASPPADTVHSQIEVAREMLEKEPQELAESTMESNPVRQTLLTQYLQEKALADSLAVKLATEEESLQQEDRRLTRLIEQEPVIDDAERRLKQLQANCVKYADMTEQVRISHELVRSKITNVVVIQNPTEPLLPVRPRKALNLICGVVGGLLCGLTLAFAVEFFDDSFKRPEEVTETLGLRVLASLPQVDDKGAAGCSPFLPGALGEGLACRSLPPGLAGPFKRLGDSLSLEAAEHDGGLSLMVSACSAGEGASTVALNLAAVLAQTGRGRVLLVDGNLLSPQLHSWLGKAGKPGLVDVCRNQGLAAAAVVRTAIANLDFLPAGRDDDPNQSLAKLLSGPALQAALAVWRRDYQFLILDTPPLVGPVDVGCFAKVADQAIWVIEAEGTRHPVALHAKQALVTAGIPLAGVIMNRRRFHIPAWFYSRL